MICKYIVFESNNQKRGFLESFWSIYFTFYFIFVSFIFSISPTLLLYDSKLKAPHLIELLKTKLGPQERPREDDHRPPRLVDRLDDVLRDLLSGSPISLVKTAAELSEMVSVSGRDLHLQLLGHADGQVVVILGIADEDVKVFSFEIRFRKKKFSEKFVVVESDSNPLADAGGNDEDGQNGCHG